MSDAWLTAEEGRAILLLARETIEAAATDSPLPEWPPERRPPSWLLNLGVFVTLHLRGELRGCIGEMNWEQPLYQNVQRAAVGAALRDPRFYPLMVDDLSAVHIEVTILSPLETIPGPDDFDPAIHGICLELQRRRAVFLPQVAREYGWGREQTLENLCHKAGLPTRAWRDPDAVFKVFTVQIFAEPQSPKS